MKFAGTDYTKDELIALACKIAKAQAKKWRDDSEDSFGWDHYEGLREAFDSIANEYESKEG